MSFSLICLSSVAHCFEQSFDRYLFKRVSSFIFIVSCGRELLEFVPKLKFSARVYALPKIEASVTDKHADRRLSLDNSPMLSYLFILGALFLFLGRG